MELQIPKNIRVELQIPPSVNGTTKLKENRLRRGGDGNPAFAGRQARMGLNLWENGITNSKRYKGGVTNSAQSNAYSTLRVGIRPLRSLSHFWAGW